MVIGRVLSSLIAKGSETVARAENSAVVVVVPGGLSMAHRGIVERAAIRAGIQHPRVRPAAPKN
eukprot:1190562-Prorocentrum_minimum.AAC.2